MATTHASFDGAPELGFFTSDLLARNLSPGMERVLWLMFGVARLDFAATQREAALADLGAFIAQYSVQFEDRWATTENHLNALSLQGGFSYPAITVPTRWPVPTSDVDASGEGRTTQAHMVSFPDLLQFSSTRRSWYFPGQNFHGTDGAGSRVNDRLWVASIFFDTGYPPVSEPDEQGNTRPLPKWVYGWSKARFSPDADASSSSRSYIAAHYSPPAAAMLEHAESWDPLKFGLNPPPIRSTPRISMLSVVQNLAPTGVDYIQRQSVMELEPQNSGADGISVSMLFETRDPQIPPAVKAMAGLT